MCDYPFATLVVVTEEGIEVNHLPVLLRKEVSDKGVIVGHIARANPLWEKIKPDTDVVVIFHGPNGYISPNWYPTKQEHGKVVPTWNYAVVHARGRLQVVHDGQWLNQLLHDLTQVHEATSERPWSVNDAPADYLEKLTKAIVGIEIQITQLEGKWKLSQNQPEVNRLGVIDGLGNTKEHHQPLVEMIAATQKPGHAV